MLAFSGLMFLVPVRLGLDLYAACPAKYGDGSSFRPGDIVQINVIASTYQPVSVAVRARPTTSITHMPLSSKAPSSNENLPMLTPHVLFLSIHTCKLSGISASADFA